ncbi:MAG TPA: hypothetical protein VGO56_13695 [Pyrinomonadaceae bacterium]|nr:hypothetical protein [Pyrinomonadaceae bacterium]
MKHSPLAYDLNFNETVYRDWSYDAAGRMVQVQETATSPSSVATYTTGFDGDGQPVREASTTGTFTTTAYMIRSSVLDDVVTRLDSAGNKTKTVVNVDGMLKAVQFSIGGSNSVLWTHIDPLGLSEAADTKPVYDALGNYVPWQHVPSGPPPNAYPPFSPNFGGLGSGFGTTQSVSCTDQGMPINCNTAMRLISNGSATIGSIISNQQPANFFASMGMAFVMDVNTTRTKTSSSRPGRAPTPPRLWPPGTRTREPDPGPGGDGEGGSGATYNDVTTVSFRLVSVGGAPQNTLPLPSNLRDRVSDVLSNPKTDCADFIKKLLGAAAKYGKAFSDNALDLFDRVQREAGFKLKGLASDHGGGSWF